MKNNQKIACVISSYAYVKEHINYGALLQYYALEKVLLKCGISAYWLRYFIKDTHKVKHFIKKTIKYIVLPTNEQAVKKTIKEFERFLDKYCSVSSDVYDSEESLETNCPQADVYITGSDQVWGGTLQSNYLCFVPDNKIKCSYAASFGKAMISDKQKDIISPWIKRLNQVSVREYSGIAICNSMGVEATQVLDPTMLIDADDYPTHIVEHSSDIFCYFLNINSNQQLEWEKVQTWANNSALTLKVACTENTYKYFAPEEIQFLGPEQWLTSYRNAKYILTNTFHGTVFAIIFNKPFIVIEQTCETKKQNERIYSLLNNFGLMNRLYNPNKDIETQIQQPIDWNKVNQCIINARQESIKYIKKVRDLL